MEDIKSQRDKENVFQPNLEKNKKKQKKLNRKDFEESTLRLNELDADSNSIERIAREKYLMKKPNEDVYVFEEDLVK